MSFFTFGKNRQKNRDRHTGRADACRYKKRERIAGNVFFALFAAVAMVGTVGYGFNTVLRGPISTMTEVTRRTVAESTVVTSSRLAIVGATTQQAEADCDNDGMVEPLPFRDAAGLPAPVGGGYLPTDLVPNPIDPWKTEYGYCAWDSGSVTLHADCGDPANRLAGAPDNKRYSIAIISAGKDRTFQTSCEAFDAGNATASLVVTPDGSDDIVLGYTYAEANDLGAGMWRPDPTDPENVAETRSALQATGGGTFSDAIVLQGNVLTGGGLVLPGDAGNNLLTGPCNLANDRQIRRNTSTTPPSLEICNFTVAPAWTPLSGMADDGGGGGGLTGTLVSHWMFDEASGALARDSAGGNNGFLQNGPTWAAEGISGGALTFVATDNTYVRVPRSASLEPTAVTVSAWIRRNGAQNDGAGILAKTFQNGTAPTNHSYGLSFYGTSDTEISWHIGYSGGQQQVRYDGIPNQSWVHVTATYDPGLVSDQMKLYINGALVGSETLTQAILYDTTNSGNLYIGSTLATGTTRFTGDIDDVRLYNYVLNDAAISDLYEANRVAGVKNTSAARKGRMVTWGENAEAEIGNGTAADGTLYSFPTAVVDGSDFIQVGMGCHSACGLKAGGSVWCWGSDDEGQLGNGPDITGHQSTPTKVMGLNDVIQISAGCTHACALKRNGEAWCWGEGNSGRLGNGTVTAIVDTPTKVSGIDDFTFIAAGLEASCGIRQNGEGWCWGGGTGGQLGNGGLTQQNTPVQISNISNWAKINLSRNVTEQACGITKDGRAYCWGTETRENLGNGGTTGTQTVPSAVLNSAGSDVWTDWIDIETTNATSCGVRANGTAWCWGGDYRGQIGNGSATNNNRTLPTQVSLYTDFARIAVGTESVCGIRQNKDVVCWGSDISGELANGNLVTGQQAEPYPTPLKNVVDLSILESNGIALIDTNVRPVIQPSINSGRLGSTNYSSCGIDLDGTAWCWGANWTGQLGVGDTSHRAVPAKVVDNGPWLQLTQGDVVAGTICGIKVDGTAWCWGDDTSGALGNGAGATASQSSPNKVTDDGPWSRLASGGGTTCGLKVDGTAWCWGRLMGSDEADPVQVGNDYNWKDVSAGRERFCGITTDGVAMCQGLGTDGILGNGQTDAGPYLLSAVKENGPWIQISTSELETCGIKADGTAWCWGNNTSGRLGNGMSSGIFATPQLVADQGPWAYISAGYITCGIKTNGTAWCWGTTENEGQLGTGQMNGNMSYPAQIPGGGHWTSIAWSGCGMKDDGSVWCWGYNDGNRLGNPAAVGNQAAPYRVANFPHPDPWMVSEDNGGVNLRKGLGVQIGTQRRISGTGAAGTGLQLSNTGRMNAAVSSGTQQFIIESAANTFAAQLTLKTPSVQGFTALTGIVGWWRLNESSGNIANDELGSNPGNTFNSPTWLPAGGRIGGALSLASGSDQYVRIPRSTALEPANGLTVSAWVRRNGVQNDWASMVQKTWDNDHSPLYQSYALRMYTTSNRISFTTGHNDGGYQYDHDMFSSIFLPDNTWSHVVGVYDPTGAPPQKRLYIDTVLVASDTQTGPLDYDTSSAGDLYIGASGPPGQAGIPGTFHGAIDEVQIYGRALSVSEINSVYNNSVTSNALKRTIGADATSGTLKIARDATGSELWLGDLPTDMEISSAGNVGIGTSGSPQAKLDVRGAIKIGNDGGGCIANKAGTIQWTGTEWQYCNGSAWAPFGSGGSSSTYWKSVTTGSGHACGILADGSAWCWGDGASGGIGNGYTINQTVPTRVQTDVGGTGWNDWVQIAAGFGENTTCGIRADASLWCWGNGSSGQLGNGNNANSSLPVRVDTEDGVGQWNDWVQISVGQVSSCGIRIDGSAWCWGYGDVLGNGDSNVYTRPSRVHTDDGIGQWNDWVQINTGYNHTCGLRADGSAWCWGGAQYGQLGDGTTNDRSRPVRVDTEDGVGQWNDWIQISVKIWSSCGIRADGSLWCWGNGDVYALGNNDTANQSRPIRVHTDDGVGQWNDWIQVNSEARGCGIRADGSAWCWGADWAGQGGINRETYGDIVRPHRVHTNNGVGQWNDWIQVQTGGSFTCGIRAEGSLWCWGLASDGRLGNGDTTTPQYRPVRVEMSP